MDLWAVLLLYTGFLIVSCELLTRIRAWALLIVAVLPCAMIPTWLGEQRIPFFWVKTFSVSGCMTFIILLRSTCLGRQRWALFIAYVLVLANIIEATATDFKHANYTNGVVGVVTALTLPGYGKGTGMSINWAGKYWDLEWHMPVGYVCLYTLWNINFVYSNYYPESLLHVCVLSAPLLIRYPHPLFRTFDWCLS